MSKKDVLSTTVGVLGISSRARNALRYEGINTLGELVRKTERDLLKMLNMGKKQVGQVKESLTAYGLTLGMKVKEVKVKQTSALSLNEAMIKLLGDAFEKQNSLLVEIKGAMESVCEQLNKQTKLLEDMWKLMVNNRSERSGLLAVVAGRVNDLNNTLTSVYGVKK